MSLLNWLRRVTNLKILWRIDENHPDFGFATIAKPRPGEPDIDLSNRVKDLLYGKRDPARKPKRVRVILEYVDGGSIELFASTCKGLVSVTKSDSEVIVSL